MEHIKRSFKNRSKGFYLGLFAAVVFLISDLAFFIFVGNTDRTYHNITFIFILLGVLSELFVILTDLKVAALIPVVFYSIALGKHFYQAAFPLADYFTGVNFFGGNVTIAIVYSIIFLLCTVAAVISCFMDQRKVQHS